MNPRRIGIVIVMATLVLAGPTEVQAHSGHMTEEPIGVWPVTPDPEVVRRFDPPSTPYGSGHRGVDLAGAPGQAVRSALPGTVSYAGLLAGRGVVVVSHGETRTTYEPVVASVGVGEVVEAGGRIGRLTATASHCLPRTCLHWGWLRGEVYLDPLQLVGARPVRLLPLWRDRPIEEVAPDGPVVVRLADALVGMPLGGGLW
jgi:murein DD-endopeptidase MepM/ murein hydrolase activator NlpD